MKRIECLAMVLATMVLGCSSGVGRSVIDAGEAILERAHSSSQSTSGSGGLSKQGPNRQRGTVGVAAEADWWCERWCTTGVAVHDGSSRWHDGSSRSGLGTMGDPAVRKEEASGTTESAEALWAGRRARAAAPSGWVARAESVTSGGTSGSGGTAGKSTTAGSSVTSSSGGATAKGGSSATGGFWRPSRVQRDGRL